VLKLKKHNSSAKELISQCTVVLSIQTYDLFAILNGMLQVLTAESQPQTRHFHNAYFPEITVPFGI
jgi:hypothetical protein